MKMYMASLAAGLLVGVAYSMLNVRSPAPPVVALLGLLGMLLGEQIVPVARSLLAGHGLTCALTRAGCVNHLFGHMPGGDSSKCDLV